MQVTLSISQLLPLFLHFSFQKFIFRPQFVKYFLDLLLRRLKHLLSILLDLLMSGTFHLTLLIKLLFQPESLSFVSTHLILQVH